MIIWIIGLSGSGKSSLSTEVASRARRTGRTVIWLDGDGVRALYGNDLGHDLESRKINSMRILELCAYFDAQGSDVVCSFVSAFSEHRVEARARFSNYFEVYLHSPIETLVERNSRNVYLSEYGQQNENIVGLDIAFSVPEHPDLVIRNDGSLSELLEHADEIVFVFGSK